ncbi:uncharacterized protein PITG_00354 [Phytophthora infestans T30-4]|uniref:DDE Tnp4 domain-containing protein n=1 Tax=Phytophthora infestans (strain T30-4) TaxID=403677 RepID=D0MQK9_PHYIT|nr:uncharacterized protein PITG_00354 [Phytophthora infestans T30-4]EEY57778.1 conserved hypothetical protein [Phytophthora infestans T30-4]|eukprot:XP_002908964.1 conserved hypothetical protein [Phytophthora infestans T30-4]
MLLSWSYDSWFVTNLRCSKKTFLREHSHNKKVAAALYFMGSTGGYREVGVVRALRAAAPQIVAFPRDQGGWDAIKSEFAARHGYPGCYPALNVQAIVTSDNVFLSAEVRSGSWSDRKCWQYSKIGRTLYSTIPPGTHFIGDAGYALLPGLIVPYSDREEGGELSPRQRQFNVLHSSTRMAVESTFGIWKGRFRIHH